MFGMYLISSLAGVGLAASVLFLSLVWTGFFFVFVVLISIAMMVWGDGVHHAWLDRCWWGRLIDERYLDEKIEMQQYQLAMGGF